ncbi:hypothetical protein H6F92_21230 [Microcystis wesenbergii FACHB-1317]|uniref:hypothetical protein n=1 Tax=Microcystis TaxID=1125 RepID=UPI0016800A67|nr:MULTISPECIES: hypothetical protein [Microcystis]MBD2291155.1 hypothetical protein [Microcystis wesenbergii FACHB-1317]UZO79130.1 hypothetical protein M8120_05495 [Microcystis aeruginosa str. Chao 1910]
MTIFIDVVTLTFWTFHRFFSFIENLGLKPRRSTTALPLNMSIVYEIYAKM